MSSERDANSGSLTSFDSRASGRHRNASGAQARAEYINLCAFWIGERCFAIDTWLVGEVVSVENCIQVPLAPLALRGVFNLRGDAVPLISLSAVLNLRSQERSEGATIAVVLRAKDMLAALIADRMEPVLTDVRERITPPANGEDPVIFGFLELASKGRSIVSVLESSALVERLLGLNVKAANA
ncbi:MAG TPA: chemotaxis protein CheW [Polyangiaceae bacterium]|nr:chemotaxis protein CheW [Polyangiaceae bacterium]